jgi:hypothetical protein
MMWYLIQRAAKESNNPAVLKVHTVRDGRISTYTKQEDIKEVMQK